MNVKNCKKCGKIFNYAFGPIICQDCLGKEEQLFQEVKKYVEENPGSTIMQITENVEGSTGDKIKQWVREDRLQLSDDSPIQITCENCGTIIRSGRLCGICLNNVTKGFSDAFGLNKPKTVEVKRKHEQTKMRFIK